MKQRWQQSILLITLIASQSLSSFARQIPPPHKHLQSLHQRSQWRQQGPQHFENQPGYKRISRQADDGFGGALQMVQLGVKYLPTIIGLFNSLTGGEAGSGIGGSGGGGAGGLLDLAANFLGGVTGNTKVETSAGVDPVKAQAATTNNVDRIDPTDLVKDDPFSMSNLIRMGIKVALAVFSSYTNDDIDRIDKVSPTQAVLGTIISAVTGSENPQEVAVMAKQATDVINLLVTLVEAVGTSITS